MQALLARLPCPYRHDWKIHKNGATLWFECRRCSKRGWSTPVRRTTTTSPKEGR